jgi:hypothetical protein
MSRTARTAAASLSRSVAAARRLRSLEAEIPEAPRASAAFSRAPIMSFVVACIVDDEVQADAAVDCAASMLAVLQDDSLSVTLEVHAASAVAASLSAALDELAWGERTGFRVVQRPGSVSGPSTAVSVCCHVRSAALGAASSSAILVWLSPFALFVDPSAFGVLRGAGDAGSVMSVRNGLGLGGSSQISTRLLVVPPIRASCFGSACSLAQSEGAALRREVPAAADALLSQAVTRLGLAVHPLSSVSFPSCPRSKLPDAMPAGTLIVFALP